MISTVRKGDSPIVAKAMEIMDKAENEAEQKTGDQLLTEAIKDPTINIYLDRSPKLNTPRDYEELTKRLQTKRALFIAAEQRKKEPKIEGEE